MSQYIPQTLLIIWVVINLIYDSAHDTEVETRVICFGNSLLFAIVFILLLKWGGFFG